MSDISGFINKLNTIKNTEVVEVWVPSLNRNCEFTLLTIKQQKDLLKSSVDGTTGIIDFAKKLNEIILENIVDKNLVLSAFDKNSILIGLRIHSLGNLITIEDKQYDLNELLQQRTVQSKKFHTVIDHNGIQIQVNVPTLKKEVETYDQCIIDVKRLKESNINDSISILYVYEFIKYIESITYEGEVINFRSLSTSDKKLVVDHLPIFITQKIVKHIAQIRKLEDQYITFSDKVSVPFNTLFFDAD